MCSKRCAKPVRPGASCAGPDVIPEIHAHDRQPAIFRQDHLEAIRQRVLLDVDLRDIAGGV